jgi:hypothetical protein
MRRTNIYLDDEQARGIDDLARARLVSRASLIRQLIDRHLASDDDTDLDGDLAAIEQSFGVESVRDMPLRRGPDERSRHLDKLARRS